MNLGKGNHGPNVRGLQKSLNLLADNSALDPLEVDGKFGPMTQARVVEFQRQASLQADGVVGPRTAKALLALVTGTVFQNNS
jgi:peptidoglycan hydrolase-like protein with peptidoglycan-binding domain